MRTKKDLRLDPALAIWLGDDKGSTRDGLVSALDRLYGSGPTRSESAQAQSALLEALKSRGPTALVYAGLPTSPLGAVFVALSRMGLVALEFGVSERTFLERVRRETGARAEPGDGEAKPALQQVREYLEGKRTRFALPIDLSRRTDFQRQVLEATLAVPAGRVATYHEIARRIGRPRAARAVGRALATNPIPLVIPCHRVIASDGSLTGYGGKGGIATKARLLKMEGALAL